MRVISIRDLELTIHDDIAYTREQLLESYWSLHPRYRFLKSVPVNSKLLDMGAGSGGLQFWREWGKPQRLDIAMYAVDRAKGEHFDRYTAYQICNIEKDNLCLPVPTFDAIHVSHVLECTTDKPLVLHKLAEALSPSGRLYLEVPTPETRTYPSREEFLKNGIQISTLNFFDDPAHIDTPGPDELRELVRGMGLHIVEQGTIQNPFLEDQLIAYGVERGDAEVTTYGVWSKLRWAYYMVAQNPYSKKVEVYNKNCYFALRPSGITEGLDTSIHEPASAESSCKEREPCTSYVNKIQQEIAHYKEVKNVHDLPSIFHYWSHNYLRPKLESLGFSSTNDFYLKYIKNIATRHSESSCEILSVGAGNCDTELNMANLLIKNNMKNFTFTCLDINPHMLERGKKSAYEAKLLPYFNFIETDINAWNVDKQYQIIIANHSLHHFVDLEILFDKIYRSLDDKGFFLTSDMIGRNGHMRWPEALEVVLALWSTLEDRHKWNHQLNRFEAVYEDWDCSVEGFEGIRAQDILPLLLQKFRFHCFIGFANLISIFIDRSFGHNFDTENPWDRYFIDFVAKMDDYYIELGKIKPTQMVAAMTKFDLIPVKVYKHLTPEFCVRFPD